MSKTHYVYHIFPTEEYSGKVGATTNVANRVEFQQGAGLGEYEILFTTKSLQQASDMEIYYQDQFGYDRDDIPYAELKCNKNTNMLTLQKKSKDWYSVYTITSFEDLFEKGGDGIAIEGEVYFDKTLVNTILNLAQRSKFKGFYWSQRAVKKAIAKSEEANKPIENPIAFAELDVVDPQYIISNPCPDDVFGKSLTGLIEEKDSCHGSYPRYIRDWATTRGLYDKGDVKTQFAKLIEEIGELGRAVVKKDDDLFKDSIGDAYVVLVNLAHLAGTSLEECVELAYNEIKNRKGKMVNGSFVKDE